MTIDLTRPEWDQILAILSKVQWDVANPLLMKIGAQLQQEEGLLRERAHAETVARLMQADGGALKTGNTHNMPKDQS